MTIKARVMAALADVGFPVYFGGWKATTAGELPPNIYAAFTTVTQPHTYADNRRKGWRHYVYITLWASGTYTSQRQAVIDALESAGFAVTDDTEDYEDDTKMFRCSITAFFLEAI